MKQPTIKHRTAAVRKSWDYSSDCSEPRPPTPLPAIALATGPYRVWRRDDSRV